MRWTLFVVLSLVCYLTKAVVPDGYCARGLPQAGTPTLPLKHLTLIFRHGDRSPIHPCWPSSPPWDCTLSKEEKPSANQYSRLYMRNYLKGREVNPGNCAAGQLTTIGYDQHLQNGQTLAQLYVSTGQLPSEFDTSLSYVRSTNKERTFASLEALMFGLYPPSSKNDGQCFSPLQVNTMDRDEENMVPNDSTYACPRLHDLRTEMEASANYKQYIANVRQPLIQKSNKVYGLPPDFSWAGIFDCTQGNLCHNLTIPAGVTQQLYQAIVDDHYAGTEMLYDWQDPVSGYTYSQLAMGSFVSDVFTRIDNVARNTTQERLAVFSGHDNTVEPLLNAFGIDPRVPPPYAAIMRIELLDGGSKGDQVRMYYNERSLIIPGCEFTCPYSYFRDLCGDLINAATFCKSA